MSGATPEELRAAALARARRRRRLDNLGRGGLLAALLLFLPLFRDLTPQDQFILPKRVLASGLMAVALLWWGWGVAAGRRFRISLSPVLWALLAFWGAHALGWLFALRAGSSAALAGDRLGWATLALVFALFFQDFARGRRKYLLALGWAQIVSAAITAVWVLHDDYFRAQGAFLRLPDWRGYLSAGLGNSGHIADWIALSFPAAILFLLRVKSRLLAALLIAHLGIAAAAMIVCWSVHSNGGLIVASLFLLHRIIRKHKRIIKRWSVQIGTLGQVWMIVLLFYIIASDLFRNLVLIWIVGLVVGLVQLFFTRMPRADRLRFARLFVVNLGVLLLVAAIVFSWDSFSSRPLHPHQPNIFAEAFGSDRWKEGGSSRLVIWGGAASMIFERPIAGWGAGNFTYGYPQARNLLIAPDHPLARAVGQWTNAAHNEILQTWAELGIIGLLALIALVWLWFGAMRRTLGRGNPINDDLRLAATTMAIMGCLHAQMNFPLQLPSFFFFYAGLAIFPLCLVDRNRRLRENRMEFEFDFRWIQFVLRGEGMLSLRGLAFSLRLGPAARVAVFLAVAWLAVSMASGAARRFVAHGFYRRGYEIVQHARGLQRAEAEAAFARALALDPTLVDARSDRAKLRYLHGDWAGVLADTTTALETLQAPKLFFWRAEARLRTGDREGAAADLLEVLGRTRPHASNVELATAVVETLRALESQPPGRLFAVL